MFQSLFLYCTLFIALSANNVYSQDLVEDISDNNNSELFSENIHLIARSQRIFILTNTNQLLNKGDFITLTFGKTNPIARALVAKNNNELSGIKILKIYSLKQWAKIKQDTKVDILKGDDSILFKKTIEKPKNEETKVEIQGEEDLYNDVQIEEDIDFLNKDSRHIKPDNLVGFSAGLLQFENTIDQDVETNTQIFGHWSYQFADNFWIEGLYGRTLIDNFPAPQSQTLLNNFVARVKYTFKTPLYTFVMPYVGFQQVSVNSPDAGQTADATLAAQELELIDSLARSGIVVGVTIYRRLVPGWFVKADLGSDDINIGFVVEF